MPCRLPRPETREAESGSYIIEVNMDEKEEQKQIDPVCEMEVTPETAACSIDYKGKTYYFCAQSCKHEFQQDPESFIRH
jgi:Cu+-exporting ATPase